LVTKKKKNSAQQQQSIFEYKILWDIGFKINNTIVALIKLLKHHVNRGIHLFTLKIDGFFFDKFKQKKKK